MKKETIKNREGVMKSLVSYAPAKLQTKDSGTILVNQLKMAMIT